MSKKCKLEWCQSHEGTEKIRELGWLNGWCDFCYEAGSMPWRREQPWRFGEFTEDSHNPDEPDWFMAP